MDDTVDSTEPGSTEPAPVPASASAPVSPSATLGKPSKAGGRASATMAWAVGTAAVTSAFGMLAGALLLSGTVAPASVAVTAAPRLPPPANAADVLLTAKAVLVSTANRPGTFPGGSTAATAGPNQIAGATATTAVPVAALTSTTVPVAALTSTTVPVATTTTAPLPVGSAATVNPWLAPSIPLPDPAVAPVLGWGDGGPLVAVLQTRLAELGYRAGADGSFGPETWSAVLAFQKAEVLERTEEVDAATWARLARPLAWKITPSNRFPRVEVDLERQVAIVVLGRNHVVTLNTSTGGGYDYRDEYGNVQTAETPVGLYAVYDAYDAVVTAPLGQLYRPIYFEGGYAIHGSGYVPSYPDSHGCVRLANIDMDWVFDLTAIGMPVSVYATMNPAVLPGQPFAA